MNEVNTTRSVWPFQDEPGFGPFSAACRILPRDSCIPGTLTSWIASQPSIPSPESWR
jgi:hypothetical protein